MRRYSLKDYTPTVRKIIEYIRFHLTDPELSLQAIADNMGAHPSHLSRLWSKEMKQSLPSYITAQRVSLAKELLKNSPNMPVSQVATSLGYADTNYFTKVFRKSTGTTPTEYRNSNRTQAQQA